MRHAQNLAGRAVTSRPDISNHSGDVAMTLVFVPETGAIYVGKNKKNHHKGELTVMTGKVEYHETPLEAAKRESTEEGYLFVDFLKNEPIATIEGKGLHDRPLTFHVFIAIPQKADGEYLQPHDSNEIAGWHEEYISTLLEMPSLSPVLKAALIAFKERYQRGDFKKIKFFKETPPLA